MFFCSFWLHLATYNLDFKCGQQETERADQTFFIEETIYCSIIEQSLSNNNTFRFIYLYLCTQCLELFCIGALQINCIIIIYYTIIQKEQKIKKSCFLKLNFYIYLCITHNIEHIKLNIIWIILWCLNLFLKNVYKKTSKKM